MAPSLIFWIKTSGGKGTRVLYFNKVFRWHLHMVTFEKQWFAPDRAFISSAHMPQWSNHVGLTSFYLKDAYALGHRSPPVRGGLDGKQELSVQLRQGLSTNTPRMLVSSNGWDRRRNRRMWPLHPSHPCMRSHVWLFRTSWMVACQAPLFMQFPRQESWSGLLFSTLGGLPNPGIKPTSMSLALAGHYCTTWEAQRMWQELSDAQEENKNRPV